MGEWDIVLTLVTIIGLFSAVGAPVLKLNSNIVKLNTQLDADKQRIDHNEKELAEQRKHAHECHQKIWDHESEQDDLLANHELRIDRLERK